MAVSRAGLDAARDLFAPLGDITHRHMMGGAILYADGRIFGAIMGPQGLHIRARGALAERLAADGSMQFAWTSPNTGQTQVMGYWSLPDAALDDPEAACEWARAALDAGD
ncbi:MAG: TfoX/Sxy family protein [Paracoccaceae bacterium]|jgi:DNA transformation protein|nr:TfoX/Sxy family protein [Paracoccaceae bacterium]